MSEPVSNAEIEDVLTSIRRLVSGDAEKSSKPVADGSPKSARAAKLILTQDFRVSETRNKATPDSAEPLEFHHAEGKANAVPADGEGQADPASKAEDGNTTSLESTIAELEAAIAQQEGEWEPDGSEFEEDPDAEEILSAPVIGASKSTPDQKATKAEDSAPQGVDDDQVEDAEIVETSPSSSIFDAASKDIEDAEIVDEDDFEGAPEDLLAGDDSVIDEETLREMISEIVRQELQGALGERITRNVRKLVRREINRVLASQDFE